MSFPLLTALVAFASEREAIRLKRAAGLPPPWTQDPILSQYRFCNVRRNDDRQTRLIHKYWLTPRAEDPDLWFAMTVARFVNYWPSLAELRYPVPWQPEEFKRVLKRRQKSGAQVFTGAYMIRADAHSEGKAAYLAEEVLDPLWMAREEIRPRKGDTLDSFHQRLMRFKDLGSFMAGQIVADTKYGDGHLSRASDWEFWAASGPGSRRGLARVQGAPVERAWTEAEWRKTFQYLLPEFNALWLEQGQDALTGQDLQNTLCELDKHERVRNGEGRPRSNFTPSQYPLEEL